MSSLPQSPKCIASLVLRVSFGVALLLVGLTHYMVFEPFLGMTREGLGALEPLGSIWAYILPALYIVGGALLALGRYTNIGAWAAGVALGSIPIGMMLKPVLSGAALPDMMPPTVNAFIWLIVYILVIKMSCCGSDSCSSEGK